MTDLMTPPPERDLPRAPDLRRAVLREALDTGRLRRRRPIRVAVAAVAGTAVLAVLVVLGVRLTHTPALIGSPRPTPAVTTSASRPGDGSVDSDAGPLSDAEATAVVEGRAYHGLTRPAALAEILVGRRVTSVLGDGTFVVWADVEGSIWFSAQIPEEFGTVGPVSGPAATKPTRAPDAGHPVVRQSDLKSFTWRIDNDRPDATARDLMSGDFYRTSASVARVEVRMIVEGEAGPWFSAPVFDGYAFVMAVTPGAHGTTENIDKVTTVEDRAFDTDGKPVPIIGR